jgi:hypothetical protein
VFASVRFGSLSMGFVSGFLGTAKDPLLEWPPFGPGIPAAIVEMHRLWTQSLKTTTSFTRGLRTVRIPFIYFEIVLNLF